MKILKSASVEKNHPWVARDARDDIEWKQKYCYPRSEAERVDQQTALKSWFTNLPLNSDMIAVLYPHIDSIKAIYENDS